VRAWAIGEMTVAGVTILVALLLGSYTAAACALPLLAMGSRDLRKAAR
jgi:hypothetical protein